jgi:TP53 regulating kinase-like protein
MLFKKGAEAYLYKEEWYGLQVVRKHRLPKAYRVPQLDSEIKHVRTIREARLMYEATRAGVPAPSIYFINLDDSTIIMEFIEGSKLKDIVRSLDHDKRVKVFYRIGQQIALLHQNNIVHGDLTTSNMILTPFGKVFFIDFGLGEFSSSIEDKGVDMHLMRRALESAHYEHSAECFRAVVDGYKAILGDKQSSDVLNRVKEIELRGRYFKRKTSNDRES